MRLLWSLFFILSASVAQFRTAIWNAVRRRGKSDRNATEHPGPVRPDAVKAAPNRPRWLQAKCLVDRGIRL